MAVQAPPASSVTLPLVDEHETLIAAPADAVWRALVHQLASFRTTPAAFYAHLVGADARGASGDLPQLGATLPGFTVTEVSPQHHLVLTGEHRFSRYSLTFTLAQRPDATVLSARTHARFPGLHGRAYHGLVISSQGHRFLVRRLLRSVRRRTERTEPRRSFSAYRQTLAERLG
jgi:uncharacterized protein YndB with AHSA1/START domain